MQATIVTYYRRIQVALVGALALGIATVFLWQVRDAVQFGWYQFRVRATIAEARRQILEWQDSYKPAEILTGALKELESDGELGFRAIVTLLDDEDPRVWIRTVELIDVHFIAAKARFSGYDPEPVNRVVSYIRSQNQRSLLRFLLLEPYEHNTEWRNYWSYYDPDVDEKQHWCWFWSGQEGRALVAQADGLEVCEEVLWDRFSYAEIYHEPKDLKRRAIDALVAVWRPRGAKEQTALELLKRFLRMNRDRELDLHLRRRIEERAREAGLSSSSVLE